MNRKFPAVAGCLVGVAAALYCSTPILAASATVAQVLQVTPSQEGVDYDRPKPEDVPRCKISVKKIDGHVGWIVESPEGILLRKFLDTNGDNVVDQWSFYKDGVEVYRDMATKPTGKKDEFRWLNTAGTRWGVDTAGNGKLTTWKAISAEEVTAEIVAAVANRDNDRFARVLLATEELQSLGLGKAKSEAVAGKIAKAAVDFRTLADRQKDHHPRVEMGAVQRQPSGRRAGGQRRFDPRHRGLRERRGHRRDRRKAYASADRHVDPRRQHLEDDRPAGHQRRRSAGGRCDGLLLPGGPGRSIGARWSAPARNRRR